MTKPACQGVLRMRRNRAASPAPHFHFSLPSAPSKTSPKTPHEPQRAPNPRTAVHPRHRRFAYILTFGQIMAVLTDDKGKMWLASTTTNMWIIVALFIACTAWAFASTYAIDQ